MANETESFVRARAVRRVAEIFKVDPEVIVESQVFGKDLVSSSNSDFSANEYDDLYDDVQFVADKYVAREWRSGKNSVLTVADYCNLMVRCYTTNRFRVERVLGIEKYSEKVGVLKRGSKVGLWLKRIFSRGRR